MELCLRNKKCPTTLEVHIVICKTLQGHWNISSSLWNMSCKATNGCDSVMLSNTNNLFYDYDIISNNASSMP